MSLVVSYQVTGTDPADRDRKWVEEAVAAAAAAAVAWAGAENKLSNCSALSFAISLAFATVGIIWSLTEAAAAATVITEALTIIDFIMAVCDLICWSL